MTGTWRPYGLIALAVVLTKSMLFLMAGTRYGYLSDELYFLDAAARPAWGYVDLPPLLPWLLARLPDDSLFVLRGAAAFIGALVTLVGVDLCRILGGRPFAAALVAVLLLLAPGFLSVQSIMTMNVLDQLWWFSAFWLVTRYMQTRRPLFMISLGVVLGLGVLTKWSIVALCAALPLAWLIWDRQLFRVGWTWVAAALGLALVAPHVAWQLSHDWPLLQFVGAYNAVPPKALVLQYPLLGMVLTMNPAYALFWVPGALFVFGGGNRPLLVLGTAAWICLALFLLASVKFYFAVPVFGLFIIAGTLFWQRVLQDQPGWRRAGLVAVALSGVLALPSAAPLLADEDLQQIAAYLRDSEQGYPGTESADLERYFPHFAEMHGWPELVQLTVGAWQALSETERQNVILMASHYGQAGALNRLAPPGLLPEAHGRHVNYHLWSDGLRFERGLFVGFSQEELRPLFSHVEERGRLQCTGCMARERGLRLYYASNPRLPAAEIRERLRRYEFF